MADDGPLESVHERRITWGLMLIVIVFVLSMTGIVLWITTSLIRNDLGGSGSLVTPSLQASATATAFKPTPTNTTAPTETPTQVEASSTPAPKLKRYVKFLYWHINPATITLGECTKITWETENAVSLKLYRNGELILDNAPANLTYEDCPTMLGYNVYRMVSLNKADETFWVQGQVRVLEAKKKKP
jgi:hypothetical protein